MCWCNKNLRTPCCGSVSCHPPKEEVTVKSMASREILEKSNLTLWTAYTDKKQECEILQDILRSIPSLIKENIKVRDTHDCWGIETVEEYIDGDSLVKSLEKLLKEVP